jgi:hypothetical protein
MRTSKQGSAQCYSCGLLKQLLKEGVGFAEKKWIKELHLEHITFHKSETKVYEELQKIQDLESHRSTRMVLQVLRTRCQIKVEGRIPKNMPEWRQKLPGVLVHGNCKSIVLFNLLHLLKSGANNMILTSLLRTLQLLDMKLTETVHLKVDGGSENWNSTVLAILDLLFDIYPGLKEIVSRFAAGHTHGDLGRIYGYINQKVFGIST